MKNDPIVEEVHQTRRRIMEECGGDIEVLIARLRERSSASRSSRVSLDEAEQRKRSSQREG